MLFLEISWLFEIGRGLVRLDHFARFIGKRESQHHVIDCETSHSQLRCGLRLACG
jgi:hypothetical protein